MDILGLPHAIMITTADVTDRNGAIDMVDYYCNVTDNLLHIKKVLVDGGYTGQNFADEIKRISGAEVIKRNELHNFAVLPKRWVVERSFGWLDKCRRLWKNCKRLLQNSALHKILCKSKSNQAKDGLQSKHNWGFPLNCMVPEGGEGMRAAGVNTVSAHGKNIKRGKPIMRSLCPRTLSKVGWIPCPNSDRLPSNVT